MIAVKIKEREKRFIHVYIINLLRDIFIHVYIISKQDYRYILLIEGFILSKEHPHNNYEDLFE